MISVVILILLSLYSLIFLKIYPFFFEILLLISSNAVITAIPTKLVHPSWLMSMKLYPTVINGRVVIEKMLLTPI